MQPMYLLSLTACSQPLQCIVVDQFKHCEARLSQRHFLSLQQALVQKRGQTPENADMQVVCGIAYGFGSGEVAPSRKDAQPSEECPLRLAQQMVAPIYGSS